MIDLGTVQNIEANAYRGQTQRENLREKNKNKKRTTTNIGFLHSSKKKRKGDHPDIYFISIILDVFGVKKRNNPKHNNSRQKKDTM